MMLHDCHSTVRQMEYDYYIEVERLTVGYVGGVGRE